MQMIKVVVDNKIPFTDQFNHRDFEFRYLPGGSISPADIKDADAMIIRTRTKCNHQLLANSSVKFIASATIGFDHIDTEYCRTAGITWTNAPGCNSGSVMQYVAASLCHISLTEQINLKGSRLGIIGVGNVGSKVASFARAAGMIPLLNDPPRERNEGGDFISLEHIASEADFITIHAPLNSEGPDPTYHLINNRFLNNLRKKPVLINSARGEIVETNALISAVKSRKVSASVNDCWEYEPDISRELLDKSVLATPHIAGYSKDGKAEGTAMSINALMRFFGYGDIRWFPAEVPVPTEPVIDLTGVSEPEEALKSAILHTYPIKKDDLELREDPAIFEKLRGDYPVRREFGAYRITGVESQEISEILIKAGFRTPGPGF